MRDKRAHLNVFLSRAVAFIIVHADSDIEEMKVMPLLKKFVDDYGAVHPA